MDSYAAGDRIVIGLVSPWFQSSSFPPGLACCPARPEDERASSRLQQSSRLLFSETGGGLPGCPALPLSVLLGPSLPGLPREWRVGLGLLKMELSQMTSHPSYPGAYVLPRQGGDRQPGKARTQARCRDPSLCIQRKNQDSITCLRLLSGSPCSPSQAPRCVGGEGQVFRQRPGPSHQALACFLSTSPSLSCSVSPEGGIGGGR